MMLTFSLITIDSVNRWLSQLAIAPQSQIQTFPDEMATTHVYCVFVNLNACQGNER